MEYQKIYFWPFTSRVGEVTFQFYLDSGNSVYISSTFFRWLLILIFYFVLFKII